MPPRAPSIATLAAEAWLDGVIGEGVGADDAALEADTTDDRGSARVLARIAREEAEHAALAADIADWCEARR